MPLFSAAARPKSHAATGTKACPRFAARESRLTTFIVAASRIVLFSIRWAILAARPVMHVAAATKARPCTATRWTKPSPDFNSAAPTRAPSIRLTRSAARPDTNATEETKPYLAYAATRSHSTNLKAAAIVAADPKKKLLHLSSNDAGMRAPWLALDAGRFRLLANPWGFSN